MIGKLLARGLAAGLIAGVLAGLFGLAFGEPTLERAMAASAASGHHGDTAGAPPDAHGAHGGSHEGGGEDVFGRGVQKTGLIVGTALYGAALGGVFGVVSAFLRGRSGLGSWRRSLALAGAAFAGAVAMPFLKYPPSPPGGASTVDQTPAYLVMVALSLLAVLFAWRISRRMAGASDPARHLSVAGFLVVSFVALYALLPAAGGAGDVEAAVLWQFRLASLGTQAVLWAALGCAFGLLCRRAERDGAGGRGGATVRNAEAR
ncbi:CbtA family protein [Rubrobacter aplysinae]|uniref:CbtA family protein n=1 Tax=Rubrobacter aplysinae TaxID=909625 RepID=UPI00064C15C9|nr:CbtA family protein [Rubrobacter aplysinae]